MTYIAYLDEFGHIGPYISRKDAIHNDSPVFGLAGIVLPATSIREFGTWFYQMKCNLLKFEIEKSDEHPATWEKKGAALYTVKNVEKYRELRLFTNRFFNRISKVGGFVFYVGIEKDKDNAKTHNSNALQKAVLREAIKRLNQFCEQECEGQSGFLLALDEHDQHSKLITEASKSMYGNSPKRLLIEPPFQLESHRFQTIQAADWVAGLVGRMAAYSASEEEYEDNKVFEKYFLDRLKVVSKRSSVRPKKN